jgi:hypothetical protein
MRVTAEQLEQIMKECWREIYPGEVDPLDRVLGNDGWNLSELARRVSERLLARDVQ